MQDQDLARLRLFEAFALRQASGNAGDAAAGAKKAGAASKGKGAGGKGKAADKKAETKAKVPEAAAAPAVSPEEQARRFEIIRSVGEECVTEDDLRNLLAKKSNFRLYDGFEPSGRMHIAQGIFKALNVNKCTSAGGTFVFWVADWFALMNDKMGGDLEKIKVVGEYFVEVWKGAGMNLENVEFQWASTNIIENAKAYWDQMLDIAKRFTIARIKKCCQIMGRLENKLTAAQVLYPLMQCSDVFFLKADICQLGVDQRKVNMLAREYCDFIGRKNKPVILSHHMLYGLAEGQAKMSKSNPDSAIFMEDTESEVERKMGKAYCPREPPQETAQKSAEESMSLVQDDLKNPCLDYAEHIVMTQPGATFEAGGKVYTKYIDVKEDFLAGKLSEEDLKKGLTGNLNVMMEPIRKHFATDPHAIKVLELVKQYKREEAKPPSRLKRMTKLGEAGQTVAVMAPCPTSQLWSLSAVLGLRRALKHAKSVASKQFGDSKNRVVFYLPDLNALACNCFGEDKKRKASDCIEAAYEILLSALQHLNALDDVRIIRQSEAMLMDPSDYWISVINVGRRFQLDDVHAAAGLEENRVGAIVAALMHVGDVQALAPFALVTPETEGYAALHKLSATYIEQCQDQQDAIAVPQVITCEAASAVTSKRDSESTTEIFLTEKWKPTVAKKFKQAFCEPGNIDDSPVLVLADALLFDAGLSLEIKRFDGSQGKYTDLASLRKDAGEAIEGKEGEFVLHPGDIKQAVSGAVAPIFDALDKAVASVDSKKLNLVLKYKPKK